MGFQHVAQAQVETADDRQVTVEQRVDRIDRHRFPRGAIDQKIRERRRDRVEELQQVLVHG